MKSVLIIGGGIAGITAAYHLSKLGFEVKILETTNNLGGRLTALFDTKSGEMIDNGQHALMTAYHTFLELLKECNADNLLNIQKHLLVSYYDTNQRKTILNTGNFRGKLGFLFGFILLGGISLSSKLRIFKLIQLVEKGKAIYAGLSAKQFLINYKQQDDSITRFWEPFVVATMNCPFNIASAEILVNILKKAFIENLSNSRLILPASDLQTILQPVIEKIKADGVEIMLGVKVKQLMYQDSKVVGVLSANGEEYGADYVISTIQAYSLIKLIPDEIKPQFAYLELFSYSPIVSVYIWTENEIFKEDFIAALGTDIQWIFNRNKLISKGLSGNFNHSYSITVSSAKCFENMKQNEIMEIINNDIIKLFPNFESNKILHFRIITEKFATFVSDAKTELIRPNTRTKISNLFLAGDWTNTGLPATIEGASFSGKNAAFEIAKTVSLVAN